MKPDNRWEIIEAMTQRIAERFSPLQIVLFGSFARGVPKPDSDADLMVVMTPKGSKREQTRAIYREISAMGLPKDIVVVTPREIEEYKNIRGTLIHDALQEGKILYDRAA